MGRSHCIGLLLRLISLIIIISHIPCSDGCRNGSCLEAERQTLAKFREGLNDPLNRLSSWDGPDCCKWRGVACNKRTGHVVRLDLHSPYSVDEDIEVVPDIYVSEASKYGYWNLSGQLDPVLLELKHLEYLDLSFNTFDGIPIPEFFGSLKTLRYLNLSNAGFTGKIPHHLGNLSTLQSLDVSSDPFSLSTAELQWLSNMPSLKHLYMINVDMSATSHDWVQVMNRLPSLIELQLAKCKLSEVPASLASVNFTSLRVLDLSYNVFDSEIPNWISNISSLVSVDFSFSHFHGEILYSFSELPNLEELILYSNYNLSSNCSRLFEGSWSKIKVLDLSSNQLYGEIPTSIGNFTSLVYLSLSNYHIDGPIPDQFSQLKNLKMLFLTDCMLTGQIPASLGGLTFLQTLNLANNQLDGTIPPTLSKLSKIIELDLSSNSLAGTVSENHFSNLTNLRYLRMSSNSLVFNPQPKWVPPFQLNSIELGSCSLGPNFPPWLRTQKRIVNLDLSNTGISGTIPSWFWDLTPQISTLNLSNNMIKGPLPNLLKLQPLAYIDLSSNLFRGPVPRMLESVQMLSLSNNLFSGPIPAMISPSVSDLFFFSASRNQINGTIPSSIGEMMLLNVLDLSRNKISGIIPSSLGGLTFLEALDLSENHLSGHMPESLGKLDQLKSLHLNNNSLSGNIPSSLKNCKLLEALDIGDNRISGSIPAWIGESFVHLRVLRLRSNMLIGKIPAQISSITSLQVFDVAQNSLTGPIPHSFGHLRALQKEQKTKSLLVYGGTSALYYQESLLVMVKGQMQSYDRILSLVTCVDLSRNNLTGEIPEELTSLLGLRIMNLSENHLTGKMPVNIGKLVLLESLDFSRNQLSGTIPPSMSELNFLAHLNLSYNNLSGRIPFGNQLQTLDDPSIYRGNSELCGPPVTKRCPGDETPQPPTPFGSEEDKDELNTVWFYVSMVTGFVAGFWGFCGILLYKKQWRIAYFSFFDRMKDKFLEITIVKLGRICHRD